MREFFCLKVKSLYEKKHYQIIFLKISKGFFKSGFYQKVRKFNLADLLNYLQLNYQWIRLLEVDSVDIKILSFLKFLILHTT